ncbi:four helix bundle protein [Lishizhenia tianjinensis]|uniref:Four helix bundle protein n=1 Tax=Lishizhenia tianjinensis TaxID=477690 RepID=A0A1I7AXB3_9FLAO|nr:four helix bundle protein [Lishizhenia tianjinensis]SFT79562.1 four helix bundle protein [Lishizhenia tianjinensis]
MARENILVTKSFDFSLAIFDYYEHLRSLNHFDFAKQLFRSGTSIGANVVEAQRAESRKDFVHKLKIALKEADETKYWLNIIDLKIEKVSEELKDENEQLIKLLVAIINSSKNS